MLVKTQRIYVGVVKHTLYLSIFWKETHCKKIPSQRYHQLSPTFYLKLPKRTDHVIF